MSEGGVRTIMEGFREMDYSHKVLFLAGGAVTAGIIAVAVRRIFFRQ